jgi:YHYH protein
MRSVRTIPLLALVALAAALAPGAAGAATCPTGVFPDLSKRPGAGAGYAKPSVRVSCSATRLKVASNGMPSYRFTAKTPNPLRTQTWRWSVPLAPKVAVAATSIDGRMGTLGFTTTGIPFYGPEEGEMPAEEAHGDPFFNGILDRCYGHTGPMGEYHNHALRWIPSCGFTRQKVVGYAVDGFPVYAGPACLDAACTRTATMASGYVRTGNPTTDAWDAYAYTGGGETVLDACNGRVQPDGSYGYHITTTFPYIIGCLRGTPVTQAGAAGGPMPPMGPPPMGGPPPPQAGDRSAAAHEHG